MDTKRTKLEYNELLLKQLKVKKQNLEIQIENLELRVRNQRLALDSKVSAEEAAETRQ
jgi:hypothetical protein